MIDPLTALSVTSAVIQFVDYGSKLLSQTQEIYHSMNGGLKENITTEDVTADIVALSLNLRKTQNSNDEALDKLVCSCEREANELLEVLNDLRLPRDEYTKRNSFKWRSAARGREARLRGLKGGWASYRNKLALGCNTC